MAKKTQVAVKHLHSGTITTEEDILKKHAEKGIKYATPEAGSSAAIRFLKFLGSNKNYQILELEVKAKRTRSKPKEKGEAPAPAPAKDSATNMAIEPDAPKAPVEEPTPKTPEAAPTTRRRKPKE